MKSFPPFPVSVFAVAFPMRTSASFPPIAFSITTPFAIEIFLLGASRLFAEKPMELNAVSLRLITTLADRPAAVMVSFPPVSQMDSVGLPEE